MQQVSLLGGLGDSPVLRPDRVYKTGVLSPMVGFRPGEAIMTTAQRFTQGPYTGMSLQGLRGASLVDRARAWWQDVKARARAGTAQVQVQFHTDQAPTTAAQAVVSSSGPSPHGNAYGFYRQHEIAPMAAYGESFGPASRLPHALTAQAYGQSPSLPAYASDAAAKTTMMRWRGLRWPWG